MPLQRDPHRGGRDVEVGLPLGVAVGQEVGVVAAAHGAAVGQVVATGRLHGRDRRPAHAEVALDGARHRGGGDHLAGEPAVLGVELDDGVHVGRRAADVDDDDVTGPGLVVEAAGEQLDAGQHHVGRRAADQAVKSAARRGC